MSKEPLTQRQNQAYDFIEQYLDRHRKPPTLQEIGDALDIASTNGVYKLLQKLEEKGWIEREKHKARSIQLAGREQDPLGQGGAPPTLPIVSRTPSDHPERLRERPAGTLSVDHQLLRNARTPDDCLLGRAGDDGMIETGIQKGDLLLIEEREWDDLDNRTLVAVLLQDQLLAREFEFANRKIHLRPTAPHYAEETFSPTESDYYVVGRVLGLIRTL
ncbi:LexA family protein [Salinibacter ruber]|uniref:Repressor LexA n=1 Tax=Salinibacter ruber TaxID=146919 RepID=A0A9X2UNV1_9BACT|nr:S24 family peptidase [Salinibacter ruber]MBB4091040.1 repressor LexA [Salinibacter ruber]MCS3613069.1 repressor LexA [Salinibacter ruber]MCS3616289.1 repressor LexA [Salinibacter ruber]MCS3631296.1 repressor LexA [Salinibacter ruber]MCS3647573.1 repressor LexA [Salinibacter ruber]